MALKAPHQTNILIHLAGWTLGVPLLFIAMGAGLFTLIGAPSGETFTVAFFAAIIGLPIGFAMGIVSFFVLRGVRGWGEFFAQRRAAKAEEALIEQVTENIATRLAETDAVPAVDPSDPWEGTNPYHCCQDNYDEEGRLAHGSNDCLHPFYLEQRNAS